MSQTKRIMVVIDPTSTEQPAAERAAWLAKRMDAQLDLFICDYFSEMAYQELIDFSALELARVEALRRHEEYLEGLAERFRADGLEVSVSARWDNPLHKGILRQIKEQKPTIVAKDTHYHTAIERTFFTNTDWSLIRACPVPLWLVKPHAPLKDKFKIMAAVDPIHSADEPASLDQMILEAAEKFKTITDGDLHVVHAVELPPPYIVSAVSMGAGVTPPTEEMIEAKRIRHSRAVGNLLGDASVHAENIHIIDGDPRKVLIKQAQLLRADLVVTGAIARGALDRLLVGSTAEKVMDKMPCDLLIIKPPIDTGKEESDQSFTGLFETESSEQMSV